jgi:hypothetical protein
MNKLGLAYRHCRFYRSVAFNSKRNAKWLQKRMTAIAVLQSLGQEALHRPGLVEHLAAVPPVLLLQG